MTLNISHPLATRLWHSGRLSTEWAAGLAVAKTWAGGPLATATNLDLIARQTEEAVSAYLEDEEKVGGAYFFLGLHSGAVNYWGLLP